MRQTIVVALLTCVLSVPAGASEPARALDAIREAETQLESMKKSHEAYEAATKQLSDSSQKLQAEVARLLKISQRQTVGGELGSALSALQEMNVSFNMQYLALQQKMQDESRRFTLLSNVMKTKHDTAKNSISNIR